MRSALGKASRELASTTPRNTHKGFLDIRSLARGIYEKHETSYKQIIAEEKENELKLFKTENEIDLLIEDLGLKRKNKKLIMENTDEVSSQ